MTARNTKSVIKKVFLMQIKT